MAARVALSDRDRAIDAVRGLCIISMIAAHLSKGSWLDQVTHPVRWVDGASGFVLLSGLLIGLVTRSRMAHAGGRVGYVRLAGRARLIYLAHLAIAVTALVVGTVDVARRTTLPWVDGEGGIVTAAVRVVTLQINPPYASVLSLYVVVMLATIPMVLLLHRGHPLLASGYVLSIYAMSFVRPEWSQLPQREGLVGGWSYGLWFGLFATGVAIGWVWRKDAVQEALTSRRALMVGVVLAVVGVVAAVLVSGVAGRLVAKEDLGPGRIALAVCWYFVAWRALRWALQRFGGPIRPLILLGTRSLDAYLILSVVVVTLPSVVHAEQSSTTGVVSALVVLGICLAWSYVRAGVSRRRKARRPAIPVGSESARTTRSTPDQGPDPFG